MAGDGEKRSEKPESSAGAGNDASDKLRQDINVMTSLHLKDPARQSVSDLLTNGYIAVTPIDTGSAVADPKKFLDVASTLVKAAGGGLSRSELTAITKSPTAGSNEKIVAQELKQQFEMLADSDKSSSLRALSFMPGGIGRSIQENVLEDKRGNLAAAEIFARHPELTDPKILATALESVLDKLPARENGVDLFDLDKAARSKEFTEQERGAAELARLNFDVLAKISGPNYLLDKADLHTISRLGMPAEIIAKDKKPGCEETSVAGNATKWGVGVGAVSKVAGSDQSFLNAVVAASSAALAAEIKNKICDE